LTWWKRAVIGLSSDWRERVKTPIWFCVYLLAIASGSSAEAAGHSPCDLHPTQTGWKVLVDYQGRFCFGSRGRTFSIDFVGPYSGDKNPNAETKRIEPQVLASFRLF
jgi:hypothetical protein